jgi:hypothetical protein
MADLRGCDRTNSVRQGTILAGNPTFDQNSRMPGSLGRDTSASQTLAEWPGLLRARGSVGCPGGVRTRFVPPKLCPTGLRS